MADDFDEQLEAAQVAALQAVMTGSKLRARLLEIGGEFAQVIDWLLKTAKDQGYPISPDEVRPLEQAGIDWYDKAIYFNPGRTPGPDVIWDLIHEIGHIPGGASTCGQSVSEKIEWERTAWSEGWKLAVAEFDCLNTFHDDFWAHASRALETYQKWAPSTDGRCCRMDEGGHPT